MGVEKGTAGRKRKQEAVTFELPPVLPNDLQPSGAFVPPPVGVEPVPGVADAPAAAPEPAPVPASDSPVPPPAVEVRGGDAEGPPVAAVLGGGRAGDGPRGDEKKGGPRGRKVYKKVYTTPEDEHFQSVQRGRFRREFRNLRLNPTPPIPRAQSRGRSRSRSQNELPLDIDPVRVVFLTEALQRHLNERRATQLSEHLLRSLE